MSNNNNNINNNNNNKLTYKLRPEDGFMKAETCSCYVILINYIFCNKGVLKNKIIYVY